MEYARVHDQELVLRLKKGDVAAFQEIYSRHWRKLLGMARSKLPATDSPEDLVQDLFVALWEQRERATISNLSAYLYTSLRNAIINKYRVKLLHEKYAVQSQSVLVSAQNTEEEIALNDLMASVEKELEDLPEKTHRIFRLNRLEYKSVKEIATLLHIPERTVEHHITTAVRKLRVVLKDYVVSVVPALLSLIG